MKDRRIVLCGGSTVPKTLSGGLPSDAKPLELNLQGTRPNVLLKIADISEAMLREVPDVLMDLLEIAAYVFAADQGTQRGGSRDSGERWHRHFQFHIPVRLRDVWSRDDVKSALTDLLTFLSDDDYTFTFSRLENPPPVQFYIENLVPAFEADEVLLFSGGLDSLAGAIQEALVNRRKVALVSHESGTKRRPQIAGLAAEIAKLAAPGAVRHVPVWATKADSVGREYTQRSRSFFYASLAATIASMLGRDRIRFYSSQRSSCPTAVMSPSATTRSATASRSRTALTSYATPTTAR